MIEHKLTFTEFSACLRDFNFITSEGNALNGMEMFYLKNEHPCVHFKFNHKNKQKAWKELNLLCNSNIEPKKTYLMGIFYTNVNDYVK